MQLRNLECGVYTLCLQQLYGECESIWLKPGVLLKNSWAANVRGFNERCSLGFWGCEMSRIIPRQRLHLAQQDHGTFEMDEHHESRDGFLATRGSSPEALEFVKEALDLVALLVEGPVGGRFSCSVGIGLDVCGGTEVIGDEAT